MYRLPGLAWFDTDEATGTEASAYVERKLKELAEPEIEPRYAVILHNDPINGVDFVVRVINKVFGYGFAKAVWLMLKAHTTGKSTLWLGGKHEADSKKFKMRAYGPDPAMRRKGARPLTVTVEKYG